MADTHEPLSNSAQSDLPDDTTDMRAGDDAQRSDAEERRITTVPEMRQWLRNYVAKCTGQSPDSIDESVPMVELGLSSRDAVAMAARMSSAMGW